jgi:hypothetical protein
MIFKITKVLNMDKENKEVQGTSCWVLGCGLQATGGRRQAAGKLGMRYWVPGARYLVPGARQSGIDLYIEWQSLHGQTKVLYQQHIINKAHLHPT